MKKKIIALVAAALLTLSAGSAFAFFEDYHLVRVVYNASTGNEMATDLGEVTSLISSATPTGITVGGGADAFTTGTGLGAGQFANLLVGYVALDYSAGASTNVWTSSTAATQANNAAQYDNMKNGATVTFLLNYATPSTQSVQTTSADVNSYQQSFGVIGNMANYLPTLTGEASLATLATASATQNLFFWANGDVNGLGSNVLSILTNADGSTTLVSAAPAVPIPAAVYLLGSGLMGLVGLRRKQRG